METYCKKDLLASGWTEGAIKRFLPKPEIEMRHRFQGGLYEIHLWPKETVNVLRSQPDVSEYLDRVHQRNERRNEQMSTPVALLDAIREISRTAHRWRDAASKQFEATNYGFATHSSGVKSYFYTLKERGIAAAYKAGLLRYAGVSPQGMAVYKYAEGGRSCFHSCLHPAGVERNPIEGHPEVLFVEAKKRQFRVKDVEATLVALPEPGPAFERSTPPRMKKPPVSVTCWECGDMGHIARECPEQYSESERG